MKTTVEITATLAGFDGAMGLNSFYELIQNAVTVTLGEMGSDNFTLRNNYHAMWVFTRNRIRVYKRPIWGQTVQVNCRVVHSNLIACFIQTDVTDEAGTLLFEGMLQCCVLDIESFRILQLKEIPFTPAHEEADVAFRKVKGDMEKVETFRVVPSLTDLSLHLNNAKALRPLVDSFSLEELKTMYAAPFEAMIHYNAQALYGTEAELWRGSNPSDFSFSYRNAAGEILDEGYVAPLTAEHSRLSDKKD